MLKIYLLKIQRGIHGERRLIILNGIWYIRRDYITLNEGGYLCGLTWSRGRYFDAWFKLPFVGMRSRRFTRVWQGA